MRCDQLLADSAGEGQFDETMSHDILSLPGSFTGEQALEALLAPSATDGEDAELCLIAHAIESIDTVGATATRMRVQRHLREHPAGSVTIWLPKQAAIAARFIDILGPLPDRVDVGEVPEAEPPAHFTLLPATLIADPEDARLVGEVVYDACYDARISRKRAGFVAEATVELSDNAVTHSLSAPDRPVVAVSSFGRERIVEVAVTDAGTSISELPDPAVHLRTIPGRAIQGHRGFLGLSLNKARDAEVDARVQILAGTGRLRWTATQHRTERRRYVPGTTVIMRIGG